VKWDVCNACVFDFTVQQPQLSSIRRDHDELQKKIGKLQVQREQCVTAKKQSEVCECSNPLHSAAFIQIIVPTLSPLSS